MADQYHHHRPHRLSVPPRATTLSTTTAAATTPLTNRVYPLYPPLTPTPTPSKQHRLLYSSSPSIRINESSSSLSFLLLLMFSLRSLYSLFPFLRSSSSSFSLFPFSFLVSLLSFLLTLVFSYLSRLNTSSSSRIDLLQRKSVTNKPFFSLHSISKAQHKVFMYKSVLLAIVFVVRFQALRYCGTSAMILAELSGNVAARFFNHGRNTKGGTSFNRGNMIRGPIALVIGLLLLSISWDRIDCFPLSSSSWSNLVSLRFFRSDCVRVWPMLLPFLSGFLGCYERVSMNWGTIKQLGQTRVRLISLFYTTILLFIPALITVIAFESEGEGISIWNLGWPLANTVVFGVLWSENLRDEKISSSKDFQREFFVTFVCTIVLELFYFPELSLWGLLFCGIFLSIAVTELDHVPSSHGDPGIDFSESYVSLVTKPIRHILSERKSRKIALFLLINTFYMVVEFVVGFMSNSLGLISDACHMLFDCAALAIGLYASYISRLPANNQFNYGRGRFEVLSGYVNAVFLVLVGVLIVLESFERILDPQEISTNSLLSVSIGGLVVNVVGLIFFHEEHHHAHGGSAACSHSHSDSHLHSHHQSHVHVESHDHNDCNTHHDHGCNHTIELKTGTTKTHQHAHHDHARHQPDCHDHHQHDHCAHVHRQPDIHDHAHCQPDHHHQQDQHQHSHHDHGHNDHAHHHESHAHHHPQVAQYNETPLLDEPKKNSHNHHHIDHNMEGIFLHVLADTLGSVGVVISTLLIKYKGWLAADPLCSIFLSILIVSSVIPLLRNSAEMLLQRVPKAHEQDMKKAILDVTKIKGVVGVQNIHVWSFTNTDVVGTLHLHVSTDIDKASIRTNVSNLLHDAGIKDLTLQVECVKNG